jgi:hypothetical protein
LLKERRLNTCLLWPSYCLRLMELSRKLVDEERSHERTTAECG